MNIGLIGHGFRPLAGGLERPLRDCAAGLALSGCRVRVLSIVGEGCGLPRDEVLHLPGASPVQIHRAAVPLPAATVDPPADPEIPPGALRGLVPHWCSLLAGADVVCTFGASAALAGAEIRDRLGLPFIAVLPALPGKADGRFQEDLRCGVDAGVDERSGLELAESLACEAPVVAPRGEGMAEVFGHGTGSLLVEDRDPVKVGRGILRLLDDDGREHVRRAFPLQAQTDRYLELFSSIRAARAAA